MMQVCVSQRYEFDFKVQFGFATFGKFEPIRRQFPVNQMLDAERCESDDILAIIEENFDFMIVIIFPADGNFTNMIEFWICSSFDYLLRRVSEGIKDFKMLEFDLPIARDAYQSWIYLLCET